MQFNVAGISFKRDRNAEIAGLRPVGAVSIVPEPDNQYDPKAMRIEYKGIALGYVPKGDLQDFIAQNGIHTASVANYMYIGDPDKHPPKGWNEVHDGVLGSITLEIGSEEESGRVIGGKYLRVTQFLKYFDPYGGGDGLIRWAFEHGNTFEEYKEALEQTAIAGTEMHGAIEQELKGESTELSRKSLPEGWEAFRKKYEPEMCYGEVRFWDNNLMVTGQPDFVGYITVKGSRVLAVVDWKSSKKPSLKHKIQVAVYATNSEWEGEKPTHAMVVAFGAETKQKFSASVINAESIKSYYTGMCHVRAAMDAVGVWVNGESYAD